MKRNKCPGFRIKDDMEVYEDRTKESIKIFIRLISEFSKISGPEINILFIYFFNVY